MSFSARSVCALALAWFAPAAALAQASSPPASPAPPPGAPAPGAPSNAPEPSADTSQDAGAEKKTPATGYSYSNKPAKKASHAPRSVHHESSGPTATFPGFEQRGDGGSRFFVQLTQSVPVEERKARGTLTYVLKGAHVRLSNNLNSLVTVHFNTPASRARLVPRGKDLLFVVDLRSEVTPTWKMQEGPDKTAQLTIDFPKGNFLPADTKSTR